LKYHVPVLFTVCCRQGNGTFALQFEKPVYPEEKDSLDDTVLEYTQLFTSKLEKWVMKYPEQWFWFHRRWRV